MKGCKACVRHHRREGSLSCHTCRDTGLRFAWSNPQDYPGLLRNCHIVNFEFTEWVYIQNLQMTTCKYKNLQWKNYSGLDYHWTKNYNKICLDVRVVSLMKEKTSITVKNQNNCFQFLLVWSIFFFERDVIKLMLFDEMLLLLIKLNFQIVLIQKRAKL